MMGDDRTIRPISPDLAASDRAESKGDTPRPLPRRHHARARPDVLAVIAAGGMLGATARYGVGRWLPIRPGRFPWATFWTNVTGSFLLGLFLVLLLERFPPTRLVRPFFATGILGAFTTMSTYQVENALLIKDGHALNAVLYGLGSLFAVLGVAYLGMLAGRLTPGRPTEGSR